MTDEELERLVDKVVREHDRLSKSLERFRRHQIITFIKINNPHLKRSKIAKVYDATYPLR